MPSRFLSLTRIAALVSGHTGRGCPEAIVISPQAYQMSRKRHDERRVKTRETEKSSMFKNPFAGEDPPLIEWRSLEMTLEQSTQGSPGTPTLG
jgi:hypothetical protein